MRLTPSNAARGRTAEPRPSAATAAAASVSTLQAQPSRTHASGDDSRGLRGRAADTAAAAAPARARSQSRSRSGDSSSMNAADGYAHKYADNVSVANGASPLKEQPAAHSPVRARPASASRYQAPAPLSHADQRDSSRSNRQQQQQQQQPQAPLAAPAPARPASAAARRPPLDPAQRALQQQQREQSLLQQSAQSTAVAARQLAQQRQGSRPSSPPAAPVSNDNRRRAASVERRITQRSPVHSSAVLSQRQQQHQSPPPASTSSSSLQFRPLSSRLLSAAALEEHERAIRASEAAAAAPSPVVRSVSQRSNGAAATAGPTIRAPAAQHAQVAPSVLHSELHALDAQIRQNENELQQWQQQEQAEQRSARAAPHAQMHHVRSLTHADPEQQHPFTPFRGVSPALSAPTPRPFSPTHTHRSSAGSDSFAMHAPASVSPALAVPSQQLPAPSVSRHSPFVSLVDAIDSVLAKSSAAPTPLHSASAGREASHAAEHTAMMQQQMHAQQLLQQQAMQHSRASSRSGSISGLGGVHTAVPRQRATHAFPGASFDTTAAAAGVTTAAAAAPAYPHSRTASMQPSLADPARGSVPANPRASANNADDDDEDVSPGWLSLPFDEHPEIILSEHTPPALLCQSIAMMRSKGSAVLHAHARLRDKFRGVTLVLREVQARQDKEVGALKIAAWTERKAGQAQTRALQHWRDTVRSERQRLAARTAKLASAVRCLSAVRSSSRSSLLHLSFAQWREAAVRLAMRAVQGQWMREWEADLAFEARRTALAAVLLRAQHRSARSAQLALAQRFHAWRMSSVYERVRALFAAHSERWNADKQQLLALLLEADDGREAAVRALAVLSAEHDTLKANAAGIAEVALKNGELVAQLSQQQTAPTDADERRRVERKRAAAGLAGVVWSMRNRRLARAMRTWERFVAARKQSQLRQQLLQLQQQQQQHHPSTLSPPQQRRPSVNGSAHLSSPSLPSPALPAQRAPAAPHSSTNGLLHAGVDTSLGAPLSPALSLAHYAPSAPATPAAPTSAAASTLVSPAAPVADALIQPPLILFDQGSRSSASAVPFSAFFSSPQPLAREPANTPPADSAAASNGASLSAATPMSPARVALVHAVFAEFERAAQLRHRAQQTADSTAATSSPPAGLPLSDVSKALRRLGLRSGDLRTAKLTDAAVMSLLDQRGDGPSTGTTSLVEPQFEELARATLFRA